MQLLVEDEDHLEIDPNKLIERFSPAQQEKLFGEKGSDRFRQKVQEMVDSNEAKLVALVNKFIVFLLIFQSSLQVKDISYFSVMYVTNIFFNFVLIQF